jgi:hypothetical protein
VEHSDPPISPVASATRRRAASTAGGVVRRRTLGRWRVAVRAECPLFLCASANPDARYGLAAHPGRVRNSLAAIASKERDILVF